MTVIDNIDQTEGMKKTSQYGSDRQLLMNMKENWIWTMANWKKRFETEQWSQRNDNDQLKWKANERRSLDKPAEEMTIWTTMTGYVILLLTNEIVVLLKMVVKKENEWLLLLVWLLTIILCVCIIIIDNMKYDGPLLWKWQFNYYWKYWPTIFC